MTACHFVYYKNLALWAIRHYILTSTFLSVNKAAEFLRFCLVWPVKRVFCPKLISKSLSDSQKQP